MSPFSFSKSNRETLFGRSKMLNKKTLSILSLIILISGLAYAFIPISNGSTAYNIAGYFPQTTAISYAKYYQFPSPEATIGSAGSMTFYCGETTKLYSITFQIAKHDNPTNLIVRARLYGLASNSISANINNASILATSTTTKTQADLTNYGTNNAGLAFADYKTFYFDETFTLTAGTYYAAVVYVEQITEDGNAAILIGGSSTNAYEGYSSSYTQDAWAAAATTPDFAFNVVGRTTDAATPTPQPSSYLYWNGTAWVPYATVTPEPNIFENGVATPYIQMLVPIIILAAAALLGWKFAGAWGFFAGLNIGAILTYMILGSSVFPLWGIVALLVIDGLLLFGKIGIRS